MYICLVMEYCENGDLSNYIKRYWSKKNHIQPIKEKQILQFMIQVCNGLNALHENGLIHRDLKPSNVLIAKNNLLKIADFGTVKQLQRDESFKAYTLCGTPDFIANEVLLHQPYNEKLDMYSLGMIIHQMLTGKTCMLSQQWKHNHDSPLTEHEEPNIGLVDYFTTLETIICEHHGYSRSIFNLMKQLLSFNPNDRPSALECISIMREMLFEDAVTDRTHVHSFSSIAPIISLDKFHSHTISDTVYKRILSFLDLKSLYNLLQANRKWYHICQEEDVWKYLCERVLGQPVQYTKTVTVPQQKKARFNVKKNRKNAVSPTSNPTSNTSYYKSNLRNYFIYRKQALATRKKSTLGKKLVHEMLPDQLEQAAMVLADAYCSHSLFRYAFLKDQGYKLCTSTMLEDQKSIQIPEHSLSLEAMQSGNNSSILKEMNEQLTNRVKEETFLSIYTKSKDMEQLKFSVEQHEAMVIIMRELIKVAVDFGRIWVLTNYDLYNQSAVQAVAIWQHPRPEFLSVWKQVKKNCKSLKILSQLVSKVGMKTTRRIFKCLTVLHKIYKQSWNHISTSNNTKNKNNFWYLYCVGVLSKMWDNGFGSLVLQPILRTANESGLPCFTACTDDSNVSFFLRHGFALVEDHHTTADNHHSSSTTATMIPFFQLKRSDDIYVNYN
jgi:serine/threonine protein kinase